MVDKVEEKIDKVEEKIARFTYGSRSELMTRLKEKNKYVYSNKFETELGNMKVDWWPSTAPRNFPDLTADEKTVCQPFVSEMLQHNLVLVL